MAKPVLLSVDDDPDVLRAVARDLQQRYGADYRVVRADSAKSALETIDRLKIAGDSVALFLVDQRMPEMTGVELLERAMPVFPEARRVLLTAYADTDAAIRAINKVKIHYYLLKPWDPPEEQLYPVLSDLLDDWQAGHRPTFEGLRLIGDRWSADCHRIRDYLARNQVPYRWYDLERNPEGRVLLEATGLKDPQLPLLLLPDGGVLGNPSTQDIAKACGLHTQAEKPFYDVVIVGAGPAGLAAGVYAASEGLRTALIEREAPGGQAGMSSRIENYLGFPAGLSGGDLARRAVAQARRFGVEIISAQEAVALRVSGMNRAVELKDGTELIARVVILATGVSYRRLNVAGVEELTGKGVYYGAAMTEGDSVLGEDVYVVGGANSAGQGAVYFSQFARSVNLVVRGKSLSSSMSQYLIDRIEQTPNIHVMSNTQVTGVCGRDRLESVTLSHSDTGESETAPAAALFVFIGAVPPTGWLRDVLELDKLGFVLAGPDLLNGSRRPRGWKLDRDPFFLETSLPGVFAAGDVRHGSGKHVATAVGEGSMAVMSTWRYLEDAGI